MWRLGTVWNLSPLLPPAPKAARGTLTTTYRLSSSTCTPMEWNSLRLLFSVSESEIVSTWWQAGRSQRLRLPKGHKLFPGRKTSNKPADKPLEVICLDRGLKVATNGHPSALVGRRNIWD